MPPVLHRGPDSARSRPPQDHAQVGRVRLVLQPLGGPPDQLVGSVGGEPSGEGAWRVEYTGTLKSERVRTVAVVLDRGQGRILVLAACPEVSWPQAAHAINRLVDSLERL